MFYLGSGKNQTLIITILFLSTSKKYEFLTGHFKEKFIRLVAITQMFSLALCGLDSYK